jgi:hypothetical protein
MLIPFILIICFGGGMMVMQKPFNVKAVTVMAALLASVLVLTFAPPGLMKIGGAIGMLIAAYCLYAIRGKR